MDRLTQYIEANLKLKTENLYFFADDHLAKAVKILSEQKGVRFEVKSETNVRVSARSFPEPYHECNAGWFDCNCDEEGDSVEYLKIEEIPIARHYLPFSWEHEGEFMKMNSLCYDDSCVISKVFVYHTVALIYWNPFT